MPQTTPPKENPVRRNARVGPVKLPKGGRKGPTPPWPLPGGMDGFEDQAWRELWATPQAAAWEQFEWTRTVARYCRVMVAAERRGAPSTLLAQATAMEDRLGLSPKSMRMLMWTITSDEVADRRETQDEPKTARGRIKAVG